MNPVLTDNVKDTLNVNPGGIENLYSVNITGLQAGDGHQWLLFSIVCDRGLGTNSPHDSSRINFH